MADRSLKIYINQSQTICIHPVKWRWEIPGYLGGVRQQKRPLHHSPLTLPPPTPPKEVPKADRFMKNYINYPQNIFYTLLM